MNTTKINRRLGVALGGLAMLTAASVWAEPLTIKRVWPEQIVCKPGKPAAITVDINNSADTAKTAKVALTIRWGLDGQAELPGQSITIPAKGQATVRFIYPVPKDRKWGHEAQATVTDDSGARPATAREYFAVGNNPWEVGHYGILFWLRGAKQSGAIDNGILPGFRQKYVTAIEAYSWAPSHYAGMTPDTKIWSSGMGNYKEGKEDWQYLVQQAHKLGLAVITYVCSGAQGPVGIEFVRKHPDWLTFNKDGHPAADFDLDTLELQRTDPEKVAPGTYGSFWIGQFLTTNPQVGDFWIDDLIKSTEMFGWDGLRVDGIPIVVEGYDYKGRLQKLPDPGTATAKYFKKVYRRVRERFPNFLFGWNCGASGNPFFFPTTEQERLAVFPGSSYMLFESFNSVGTPAHPYHAWKKLIAYLQTEEQAVRKYGGYGHCGWMPSNRYLEAVVSACGNHVDPTVTSDNWNNYRRFEFRCSEFLWDNTLRYVRPGNSAVTVAGPAQVWWQDFVHTRGLAGGGKRVIVHLVNMPAKDDEAWADRPPAPAANVKVCFKIPAGKKLRKIAVFSPDTAGDVVTVTPAADGSVTVPAVTLWTMVVAEY